MALQRDPVALERSPTPPLVVYVSVWLMTIASVLVVRMAQVSLFPVLPLLGFATVGVCVSVWLSRRPLSEATRVALGTLDGLLAFFALTGQSFLNSLLGIATDPAVEIYLSMAFLWYMVLRSGLMATLPSAAFQSVPALALFGLIATYILANEITWLFAVFLLAMLFVTAVAHFYETRLLRPAFHVRLLLRTVLGFGVLALVFAFVMAPLLWLTAGRLVSGLVVGLPLRMRANTSETSSAPDLMVGAGPTALSRMPVMRVRLEGSHSYPYLRAEVYTRYTGRGWERAASFRYTYRPNEEGRFEFRFRGNPPRETLARARVQILNGWHDTFYAPGFPLQLEAPADEVRYRSRVGLVDIAREPLKAGEEYTIVAYAPPTDPAVLRRANALLPDLWAAAEWSRTRSPAVRHLVEQLSEGRPTDYDKVMAFKEYIARNCKYNLNVEAYPGDVDVVEHFLFEAREGYCIEFATALAVMCLYADIPARVVSGFTLAEQDPQTGEYLVREAHRHLWTEVFFEGVGWVPFDATEGAEVVGQDDAQQAASEEAGGRRGRSLERMLLDGAIALVALYLLYLLVPWRKGTQAAASPQATRMRRAVNTLLFYLQLAGAPPMRVGQTITAYLEEVLPHLRPQLPRFTELLESLGATLPYWLYGPEEQTTERIAQMREALRQLRRALWQEMGAMRLIIKTVQLGWRRVYGNPLPATQG